ncbi:N-acetylmuramoyl-L-alanine amidase [Paenibacillus sp. FSL W7-1279]|uniref:N-acetylmuramoyl-L-alanine amidase n=1 Tax=Paenibacillus sp. FSL W7-1279 TaxID=2921697 RepID=UPI0030D71E76
MTKLNIVDPGLKFKYALDPPPSKVVFLVQHHMAHKTWGIHEVHDFHKNSRGWNGIGYNWWIGFDGTIYEGRGFHYGAGVSGHNHDSLHVGYQGDFTQQQMTDAQLAAGIALNAWLLGKYPSAKVVGHKELASTACPGQYFRMDELKKGLSRKGAANVKQDSDKVNVIVNGKKIKDGKLIDDVTYVPLRAVGEALRAKVGFDNKTKTATLEMKV